MTSDSDSAETPGNALELTLKSAGSNEPQAILADIVRQLREEVPELVGTGGKWLRGKADQEWAKAYQVKALVLESVGKLELERERLLAEKRTADRHAGLAERSADLDERKVQLAHEERMYQLHTERLSAVREIVELLFRLNDKGIAIDIELVTSSLLKSVDER